MEALDPASKFAQTTRVDEVLRHHFRKLFKLLFEKTSTSPLAKI